MAEPETAVTPPAPPAAPEPAWRAPAVGVASALILFCSAMMFMMLLRYAQERSADPLNDKSLVALRAAFLANPEDGAAKEAIRAKDFEVRREFFAIQWHLNTGAWMLVPAAAVLIILLNILIITRAPSPDPGSLQGPAGVWREADRRRQAMAAFALTALVLAAVAALVFAKDSALKRASPGAQIMQKVER